MLPIDENNIELMGDISVEESNINTVKTTNSLPEFKSIGLSRLRMGLDGPGVTTLICGYACPLHCEYCINDQCHEWRDDYKTYSIQELIDTVSIDNLYFIATGGGVTFGGGEPLLYSDFIHEFRQQCPTEWKINLETSLYVSQDIIDKIIDDIDFWIIDVKSLNKTIYKNYTKQPIDKMLTNLKYIIDNVSNDKIIVKVPNIPNYTEQSDVKDTIEKLKELGIDNILEFNYRIFKD